MRVPFTSLLIEANRKIWDLGTWDVGIWECEIWEFWILGFGNLKFEILASLFQGYTHGIALVNCEFGLFCPGQKNLNQIQKNKPVLIHWPGLKP